MDKVPMDENAMDKSASGKRGAAPGAAGLLW